MFPMPIRTDLTSPSTLTKPVAPISPVTAITDSQNFPDGFIEGQKYLALIEARLFNGNSRVLVADQLLQMKLPDNFQPGSKLELVFIARKPEPQFLVINQAPADTMENNASISPIGRFLGTLIQDMLKQTPVAANANGTGSSNTISGGTIFSSANRGGNIAPSFIGSKPIFSSLPINSAELPGLLQKAIVQSGLFYESHQAQWVQGENTLENLQQEPQGKLMLVTSEVSSTKAAIAASMNPEMPVHQQAIPLVQQQLNTLETGHLFWRGEVWQGQSMDWNIYEESNRDEKNNDESTQAAQWRTQIRLSMPQLGDITATIALSAQGINIKLNTSQLDTANLLKGNQMPLATDMQSAGITIQTLEIQHDVGK